MTIRTKTVEYAFAYSLASVASATARDFTQLAALVIPETSSRTFKSVILECSLYESGTVAASLTAILMGIGLGAVGRNDATVTQTIANSGENQNFLFTRDVTSYFQTNYTGTSMTADCRLTATGVTTVNCTAKLIITYEYDDAATTQLKTVKIPIDGNIGNLSTALAAIGAASQWPALDTFLPEPNKSYKDIFFQIDAHDGTSAAATTQLGLRFDGANEITDTAWAWTLASDVSFRRIDKLLSGTGAPSTSASHSIEARTVSSTSIPYPCISGHIVVTYTFDYAVPSAWAATEAVTVGLRRYASPANATVNARNCVFVCTTAGNTGATEPAWNLGVGATTADGTAVWTVVSVMNSLQMPMYTDTSWSGGNVIGNADRLYLEFVVEEPGTIALAQSAILSSYVDNAAVSFDMRVGAQASRVFAHAATVHCGSMTSMRRFDAGAVGGAGFAIARGVNQLIADYFTTGTTAGTLGSAVSNTAFLNYTSSLHKDGPGVHAQTRTWLMRPHATGNLVQRLQAAGSITPVIPEANYWLIDAGFEAFLATSGTAAALGAYVILGEVQAGESIGAGWEDVMGGYYSSDSEIGWSVLWSEVPDLYKRWAADPDGERLDIETARDYRYDFLVDAAAFWQMKALVTYHTITYAIAGNITGSAGGTVSIKAHAAADGVVNAGLEIGSTSRAGNGAFTIPWHNNTVDVFTEAFESGALIGRSDNGRAV